MILIGEAKTYSRDIEDCLEMRGKPPITDWIKIRQKFRRSIYPSVIGINS
jgi:hypothetical protein